MSERDRIGLMEITGEKEMALRLEQLGLRITMKVMRQAMNFAATPVLKAVRANTPVRKTDIHSKRKRPPGSLRASWMKKTKAYPDSSVAVTVVGPRFGAAPHAHLVEFGTVDRWRIGRRTRRLARFFGGESTRPFFSGRMPEFAPLRNAYAAQSHTILQRFTRKMRVGVEKEAMKAR